MRANYTRLLLKIASFIRNLWVNLQEVCKRKSATISIDPNPKHRLRKLLIYYNQNKVSRKTLALSFVFQPFRNRYPFSPKAYCGPSVHSTLQLHVPHIILPTKLSPRKKRGNWQEWCWLLGWLSYAFSHFGSFCQNFQYNLKMWGQIVSQNAWISLFQMSVSPLVFWHLWANQY